MVAMINTLRIILYLLAVLMKILRPGGVKAIAAENLALKQQLITMARHQKRSPKLKTSDRIIFGFLTAWINPKRLSRIAVIIRSATLLKFHKAIIKRKYRLLFSNKSPKKPGPKGPSQDLINLILEMKQRNSRFGYCRIAMQIQNTFGIKIDKGLVKRVLDKHYKPNAGDDGPSWLSFIGHTKDSLWSVDLFRCESILLKSHWVMIVMDQFTRKIIGFSARAGNINGVDVCCMFNEIISGKKPPKYLSSDHDPLFRFHQWRANCRILEIEEIKSIPYTPTSHPYVERIIGSVRREHLDKLFFWNTYDLQNKLNKYQQYYNRHRSHSSLESKTPLAKETNSEGNVISLNKFQWKSHCNDLFQLPMAA